MDAGTKVLVEDQIKEMDSEPKTKVKPLTNKEEGPQL